MAVQNQQQITEPRKVSIGMQIFRWGFAISFLLFMLTMAFGSSDKGVSFLGFVGVVMAFVMMYKFTKRQTQTVWPDYSKVSGTTELSTSDEDDYDRSLSKDYDDSICSAGYIGIFERHD